MEVKRLEDLLARFMALQQRRQELGRPIPRASEAAMRGAGIAAKPKYEMPR